MLKIRQSLIAKRLLPVGTDGFALASVALAGADDETVLEHAGKFIFCKDAPDVVLVVGLSIIAVG